MFTCNSVKTSGTNFMGKTVLSAVVMSNRPSSLLTNNFTKFLQKPLTSLVSLLFSASLSVVPLFFRTSGLGMTSFSF